MNDAIQRNAVDQKLSLSNLTVSTWRQRGLVSSVPRIKAAMLGIDTDMVSCLNLELHPSSRLSLYRMRLSWHWLHMDWDQRGYWEQTPEHSLLGRLLHHNPEWESWSGSIGNGSGNCLWSDRRVVPCHFNKSCQIVLKLFLLVTDKISIPET